MNTNSLTSPPSIQDLSRIALQAAEELDNRMSRPKGSNRRILALAQHLKNLFPGSGRPLLPSDTIGLVCDIIETWNDGGRRTEDYTGPVRIAQKIASQLQQPTISDDQALRLIRFCLALHGASRAAPTIHDIPEHHPYVLTFA